MLLKVLYLQGGFMNKFKLTLGVIATSLLLTGCGNAKLENGSELVLEMNGIKISANNLYDSLKYKYGIAVLINEMDTQLLDKKYETTQEMKDQIESQILSSKEQLGADFNDAILYYYGAKTEKEFYEFLQMNIKKNIALKDYALTLITDEDIQKYYDEKAIGDIKAYHILIKPDVTSSMTDDEKKAKEKEAEELAKSLIKQLDDETGNKLDKFKELAKKNSKDTSNASNGGELSYFNRGDMVAEFEDAAVALKVGSYSETPVKTSFGYHIIYKTEQKEKGKLKDLKDDIKGILADEKVKNTTNIEAYAMEALREKYELKIYDAQLKIQYDDYMSQAKAK
jgi:foldase protein PrsA